jgi:hypothetical protein
MHWSGTRRAGQACAAKQGDGLDKVQVQNAAHCADLNGRMIGLLLDSHP